MIRAVVWDWNGTLLDDVDACVQTLNSLLDDRGIPRLDRQAYRSRFGFPVRRFYEELGFDFAVDDYDALSYVFISRYKQRLGSVGLHAVVSSLMGSLPRTMPQLVVSAMEHNMLGDMLADYGLRHHLRSSHGTGDLGASSKVQIGFEAVQSLGLPPDEVLLVGDTLHDHEMAEAIGSQCVLFSGGHQTRERLQDSGRPVIDDLAALKNFLGSAF